MPDRGSATSAMTTGYDEQDSERSGRFQRQVQRRGDVASQLVL